MYRVLIVDDEPFVRQGLRAVINWEQYGFTVCAEASDSTEAIELIGKYSPELVLTDIMMPEIDGLELIDMATKLWGTGTKFVIISGYDKFEYAKKAIRSNVVSYLLKPVDEDELIEVLEKVKYNLESGKRFLGNINLEVRNIIKNFIEGRIDGHQIKLAKKLFKDGFNCKMRYMSIELNVLEWLENFNEEEIEAGINKIRTSLLQTIRAENSIYLYEEMIGEYGIILNESILKHYANDIKAFTNNLRDEITGISHLDCSIYVGNEVDTLSDLKYSYGSCKKAKEQKFFYCDNDIIYYERLEAIDCETTLMDGLIEAVKANKTDEIKLQIENIIEKVQREHVEKEILKVHLRSYIFEIIKFIAQKHGNVEEFKEFYARLSNIQRYNVKEIQEILVAFSESCSYYLSSLSNNRVKNVLDEIVAYIESNYSQDLSLKILAKKFYISPIYLGQLFKKNYNIYFNDYLCGIRIEESKKLLRRSDLKINEIARKVGYDDPNYFIAKFEKVTHMTPTQYKNQK